MNVNCNLQQWLCCVFFIGVFCTTQTLSANCDSTELSVICEDVTIDLDGESVWVLDPFDVHLMTSSDTLITDYRLDRDSFFCEDFGTAQEVMLTVEDICGNSASCSAQVTFINAPQLQVDCMDDVQVYLNPGQCGRFVNFEFDIDNPCGDSVTVVQTDATGLVSGDFFGVGLNVLSFEFYNTMGDTASCSFSVEMIEFESGQTEMSCNDRVNISLNSYCEALITADFLLEGNIYRCYDDYQVIVSEERNGPAIPGSPLVTEVYLNDTLYVNVCDPESGNCCWGTILIEDKIIPPLSCEDITVDCGDDVSPDGLGSYPQFIDGDICADTTMSYEDDVIHLGCSDSLFIERIDRLWTIRKANGAQSSCLQQIFITKGDPDSISLPPHYDNVEEPAFHCGNIADWPINNDGYRIPPLEVTGIVSADCPNLFPSHRDHIVPLCGGAYKIIREWSIFDHCEVRIVSRPQVILVENSPLELNFPSDSISIGTEPWMCLANYLLPYPEVTDLCVVNGEYHFRAINPGIDVNMTSDFIQLSNIPLGDNLVMIEVTDACGRRDTTEIVIWVDDDDVPTAIADLNTKVSLGVDGTAKVYAESFDDGSIDNCGVDSFEVRRVVRGDCGDGVNDGIEFGPYVEFCCADIGAMIQVELRVYDAAGNFNSVMVNAMVEDKLPPFIICPPDITVACDFAFPDDALADVTDGTFGRVVTHPDSVKDVMVFGHGHPDFADDHVWGSDGLVIENCDINIDLISIKQINCGRGYIKRRFIATDANGLTSECTQTITFDEFDPFDESHITWPYDPTLMDVCIEDVMTDPDVAGKPSYIGDVCSEILMSYEDEIFTQDPSSCIKILRTWKILDWCQHDPVTGEGIWTNQQIIKISNTVPPTIFDAPDITVCNVMPDPGGNQVVNGSFESGLTGFDTEYLNNQTTIFEEGTYAITDNAEAVNGNYRPCGDHTTGSGQYMAINGDTILDKKLWCTTVNVEEDVEYMFGAWVTNISIFSLADFAFTIDGEQIGGIRTTDQEPCEWVEYMDFWLADRTGEVEFCIINKTEEFFRNEIALDDIYFGNFMDRPEVEDCHALAEIFVEGQDDCSDVTEIRYELDLFDDGTIDVTNFSPDATGEYPIGRHKFTWYASDGCGNVSTREQFLEVLDCQAPSPKCLSGIVTVIMESTGDTEIWASDFDAGSDDLCSDHVSISFSSDVEDRVRTFTCDDIGFQEIEVWVTDIYGNQDFCRTNIIVQDNNNVCDGLTGDISGILATPSGELMQDVQVTLERDLEEIAQTFTADDGSYLFEALAFAANYSVEPFKNDDVDNGVSTHDLVTIQKHILGDIPFDDVWDFIAADANNNEAVSALDIVDLRKILLGDTDELPDNTSWRFIREDQTFADMSQPWPLQERYTFDGFDEAQSQFNNFVAVKVGDLTGDASTDGYLNTTDRDATLPLALLLDDHILEEGQVVDLIFAIDALSDLESIQMGLAWDAESLQYMEFSSEVFTRENIGLSAIQGGELRVSWYDLNGVDESQLMSVRFRALTNLTSLQDVIYIAEDVLSSEVIGYDGQEYLPELSWKQSEKVSGDLNIYQNQPNPFVSQTIIPIELSASSDVTLNIFNAQNQMIKTQQMSLEAGRHQWTIESSDLSGPGVYHYTLTIDGDKVIHSPGKMILIK